MKTINLAKVKSQKKRREMRRFITKLIDTQKIDMDRLALMETNYNEKDDLLEIKLSFLF